jgi:hypothetical protein
MSLNEECSAIWILGRATFTTVMSSRSINVAVQTAMSVHHFRSSAAMKFSFLVGVDATESDRVNRKSLLIVRV